MFNKIIGSTFCTKKYLDKFINLNSLYLPEFPTNTKSFIEFINYFKKPEHILFLKKEIDHIYAKTELTTPNSLFIGQIPLNEYIIFNTKSKIININNLNNQNLTEALNLVLESSLYQSDLSLLALDKNIIDKINELKKSTKLRKEDIILVNKYILRKVFPKTIRDKQGIKGFSRNDAAYQVLVFQNTIIREPMHTGLKADDHAELNFIKYNFEWYNDIHSRNAFFRDAPEAKMPLRRKDYPRHIFNITKEQRSVKYYDITSFNSRFRSAIVAPLYGPGINDLAIREKKFRPTHFLGVQFIFSHKTVDELINDFPPKIYQHYINKWIFGPNLVYLDRPITPAPLYSEKNKDKYLIPLRDHNRISKEEWQKQFTEKELEAIKREEDLWAEYFYDKKPNTPRPVQQPFSE